MSAEKALVTQEVFQLNNVEGGLKPGTVSFKTLSMDSDRFVCVRDVQPDGQTSLVIVDLSKKTSERNNIKDAEAATMCPDSRILALRSGGNLQVFNLDLRQRVKSCIMNESIVYWRWIDTQTVAIVGTNSVYHWSMADADRGLNSEPTKIFDRAPDFDSSVQVLNYKVDKEGRWMMLNGVARSADGSLVGKTQIYSSENGGSRVLDGHAGTFASMDISTTDPRLCNILCLSWNGPQGGRLLMMELPSAAKTDVTFERKNVNLNYTAANDFPVALHVSPSHKLLQIISSRGQAFLVDVVSGQLIATEQVSQQVVFAGTPYGSTGGILCVNVQGAIFHTSVNNNGISRYIYQTLQSPEMALRVASSANLGGVDELFKAQFNNLINQANFEAAVKLCAAAPNKLLRTPDTMQRFVNARTEPGQPVPISSYFKVMLAIGPLTAAESVELAKVVLAKGGTAYVKQQFDEEKMEVSEQLGDIVSPYDAELAMRMYHKIGAHQKVVNLLLSRSEAQKAVAYCKRMNYAPEWRTVLSNFVRVNPNEAVGLALMLHNDMGPTPVLDPNEVIDMFLPGQNIKQLTQFLAEILKGHDIPANGRLQTRLLEINLKHSPPSVADKILSQKFCTHFEPLPIAQECERAGLFQHAIECYKRAQDETEASQSVAVRRCFSNARDLNPDWVIDFFGQMTQADSLACLEELMKNRQNFKLIVQVATKYNDALGSDNLINLFLEPRAYDILYYYLGAIVAYSRDPEIHFRYVEAALEVGQMSEVERMTRESPCYDPQRMKSFLLERKLQDLWPLINVCDRYDFISELVKYLLDTQNHSLIEQFVQRRNPSQTPAVIGALLDCDAPMDLVRGVLHAAGSLCPMEPLIEEVERRGRIKMIQPWLEARRDEKNTDPSLHNALAKIYVDTNSNPTAFLEQDDYYDTLVVGKYCEHRDPTLSLVAYTKGRNHKEYVELATKNSMWKQLAKYLVKLQDIELWGTVLASPSRERQQLVDAVQQILGQSTPDEASTTVGAFVTAELHGELTTLLDQLVVHGTFRKHRILENLLLMSAIRARKDKVMEYVNVLQDYDAGDLATIACGAELYEEAFAMYHKSKMKKEAIRVLLSDMKDLPRARNYAATTDDPTVWTVLAQDLLSRDEVHEGIDCLIRAKNPDFVSEVVAAAERVNQFGDLIKYLTMARTEARTKDPKIDTYLVLTYAKTGRLADLEEFLKTSHTVQIMQVADKCFADGLFDSARVLYTAASNFPRLATTCVRLNNLMGAVDAAQKAQNVRTWKEVNIACIAGEEVKLAHMCAVAIVVHAEEVPELVQLYEECNLWEEMVSVLKSAMGNQGAHMGIFTELAVLYAKYKPEKLMEHVKMFPKKINIHRMINVCEQYGHWVVLRVLHINNEDWLSATNVMMQHGSRCWDHEVLKDVITRLGASDVLYAAIAHYVQFHPELLHDLLTHICKKVDTERVMNEVTRHAPVSLIRPFLESAQDRNIRKVNDALNNLYVEEEDFEALHSSVDAYDNFDSAELSARLEKMDKFEFRKIALALHRLNKRYFHAINVAKKNELYSDAIEAAADSGNNELVMDLLNFFVSKKLEDCFIACLYTCYDFVAPHEVMQLAWLNGMTDKIMPYMMQVTAEYFTKVNKLEKVVQDAQKSAAQVNTQGPAGAPMMIEQGPPGAFADASPTQRWR